MICVIDMSKKCCANCVNAYIEVEHGKGIRFGCKLETEIPFFEMSEIILDPNRECCNKWKGTKDEQA